MSKLELRLQGEPPCCCYVVALLSPCCRHAVIAHEPCDATDCMATAGFQCRRRPRLGRLRHWNPAVAMLSPCFHHAVTMLLPYCRRAVAMQSAN